MGLGALAGSHRNHFLPFSIQKGPSKLDWCVYKLPPQPQSLLFSSNFDTKEICMREEL